MSNLGNQAMSLFSCTRKKLRIKTRKRGTAGDRGGQKIKLKAVLDGGKVSF
jgi:hypothetical protein